MAGGAELDQLAHELEQAAPHDAGPACCRGSLGSGPPRTRIGVGLIGFGWLGQAHSRSVARLPTLFADRTFDAEALCADTLPERLDEAVQAFGYAEAAADWRRVVAHPGVDVVVIAAPNMLHRSCTGPRSRRQARLLREAGRRHTRADRACRGRRAGPA